jgi:hypothetical protein
VTHLPADGELLTGFDTAAAFWEPVLAGAAAGLVWDPAGAVWQPAPNRA